MEIETASKNASTEGPLNQECLGPTRTLIQAWFHETIHFGSPFSQNHPFRGGAYWDIGFRTLWHRFAMLVGILKSNIDRPV